MRIVEVITDTGHTDSLTGIAEHFKPADFWYGVTNEDGRRSFRFLVDDESRQQVVDALQSLLGTAENSRIIILPVDTALPRPSEENEEGSKRQAVAATREELYSEITKGAHLDSNFLLLTLVVIIIARDTIAH